MRSSPNLSLILTSLLLLAAVCKAENFWWEKMKAVQLNQANYKNYLGKDKYVFVEFYSKGCGWCEKLYPTLNTLIEEIDNGTLPRSDIMVAKIDAEEFPLLAEQLEVDKYPTMYLFKPNDLVYPEQYEYSHRLVHIRNYLLTHPVAPKFVKSNLP